MSGTVTRSCLKRHHWDCEGTVFNGAELVFCVCLCHPDQSVHCRMSLHHQCPDVARHDHFGDYGRTTCDCPCHYIQTRDSLLSFRRRVSCPR